jgi:hypothetical protein
MTRFTRLRPLLEVSDVEASIACSDPDGDVLVSGTPLDPA